MRIDRRIAHTAGEVGARSLRRDPPASCHLHKPDKHHVNEFLDIVAAPPRRPPDTPCKFHVDGPQRGKIEVAFAAQGSHQHRCGRIKVGVSTHRTGIVPDSR